MKAYAIDEFGGPGSAHDLPVPEPEDGQVRVRVAVAGLNPFDNAVIQGYRDLGVLTKGEPGGPDAQGSLCNIWHTHAQ